MKKSTYGVTAAFVAAALVASGIGLQALSGSTQKIEASATSENFEGYQQNEAIAIAFRDVNAARKTAGAQPLTMSAALNRTAQAQANSNGKASKANTDDNFYKGMPKGWYSAIEVVGSGYRTSSAAKSILGNSFNSERLLNADVNTIGVGIAEASNGTLHYVFHGAQYEKYYIPEVTQPAAIPKTPPAVIGQLKMGEIATIDVSGNLWNYGNGATMNKAPRKLIGTGWSGFTSIHTADWNGDGIADIVAKNKAGQLYVYKGLKGGGFTRITIGTSGWQAMDIIVGNWKKTDKLPSVIAKDRAGKLWVYPRSGEQLGKRYQVGTGWAPLDIYAADSNADGAIDVIAKNRNSGGLILYKNNGAGKITSSKVVGSGWKTYKMYGWSGFHGGKSAGIVASDSAGKLWYYPLASDKFGGRTMFGSGGWKSMRLANGHI